MHIVQDNLHRVSFMCNDTKFEWLYVRCYPRSSADVLRILFHKISEFPVAQPRVPLALSIALERKFRAAVRM